VSINDLVKEEANRQVDSAIEDIPIDRKKYGSPLGKTILQYKDLSDFLLGYEIRLYHRCMHVILQQPSQTEWERRNNRRGRQTGDKGH